MGILKRGLLQKNPRKRFNSKIIKDSKWFKIMNQNLPGIDFNDKNFVKKKDKILDKIRKFGFPIDAIKLTLEKKRLNHIYSSFCLLKNISKN